MQNCARDRLFDAASAHSTASRQAQPADRHSSKPRHTICLKVLSVSGGLRSLAKPYSLQGLMQNCARDRLFDAASASSTASRQAQPADRHSSKPRHTICLKVLPVSGGLLSLAKPYSLQGLMQNCARDWLFDAASAHSTASRQ